MSILSGFFKEKKYKKTSSGYKLRSLWTSASTVEMSDGTTVEDSITELNNSLDDIISPVGLRIGKNATNLAEGGYGYGWADWYYNGILTGSIFGITGDNVSGTNKKMLGIRAGAITDDGKDGEILLRADELSTNGRFNIKDKLWFNADEVHGSYIRMYEKESGGGDWRVYTSDKGIRFTHTNSSGAIDATHTLHTNSTEVLHPNGLNVGGKLSNGYGYIDIHKNGNIMASIAPATDTDAFLIRTGTSGNKILHLLTSGVESTAQIKAPGFTNTSSKRYKENVEYLSDDEARKILDVNVHTYDYIDKDNGKNCVGFIAEEIEEIGLEYPLFRDGDGNPDALDYSRFVPYLVKMIQIQQKEIESLKENICK